MRKLEELSNRDIFETEISSFWSKIAIFTFFSSPKKSRCIIKITKQLVFLEFLKICSHTSVFHHPRSHIEMPEIDCQDVIKKKYGFDIILGCKRFKIFRILNNIWKIEFWTILIKKQNNHVPLRPLSDQLRTIELKFFILQSNPH